MDVEQFQLVLLHTFSRDQAERAQAESRLEALKAVPGFHLLLLHTITQPLPREIRQAAAIALKNSTKQAWELAERCVAEGKPVAPQAVREEDKPTIRAKALEGLINEADPKVRVLLAETVHSLVVFDYPHKWPELVETVLAAIHSGSPLFLHNGLLALRKLAKKYEFKPKKDREAFEASLVPVFPVLHQLAKSLIGDNSLEAADVLRLVLKVFWSTTQFCLPVGMSDDTLLSWMELLGHVLSKDLPEPQDPHYPHDMPPQPTDPEERKRWPWWKAKKWACMIVERFYQRYGVPRYAADSRKDFAQTFHQRVAPALLAPMLTLLSLRSNGRFCTDRVVYMTLRYVSTAIEMAPTFAILKPNLDYLLFHVVFPLLCLKDEDVELFDRDPHEYIRKMQGVGDSLEEMYYDPREEALTLIKGAVTKRSKTALPKMLAFLHQMLSQYQASPPGQRNYRHKDAALQCLGVLEELMKKRHELKGQLQALVAQHVLPEFTSPQGFMRARACWMMRHYADVHMEPPLLAQVVAAVLNCLCDRCLPVQVEAATAIRELAVVEGVAPLIVPHLEELLRQYFRLMNEAPTHDTSG